MTIHPQYRLGWRAGFVAAERASVRARLSPRSPWRDAEKITVAELIDRLAAERGVGPDGAQGTEAPARPVSGVPGEGDADDVRPREAEAHGHRVPSVSRQREGVT